MTKQEGRYRYPVIMKTGRDRRREYVSMKTKNDEITEDVAEDVKKSCTDMRLRLWKML